MDKWEAGWCESHPQVLASWKGSGPQDQLFVWWLDGALTYSGTVNTHWMALVDKKQRLEPYDKPGLSGHVCNTS